MTFAKTTLAAAAISVAASPALSRDHNEAEMVLRGLQQILGQYSLMVARSFVDLTYESLQIEPGTGALILSGLTIYPELPWDQDAACAVTIDRVEMGSGTEITRLTSLTEVNGLVIPPVCLPPDVGGTLGAIGYLDGLSADTMSIQFSYDVPSSSADLDVRASIVDAGEIELSAAFDYLWFRFPMDGGDDPIPVAFLGGAELSFENDGVWERIEPMIGGGDQITQMIPVFLGSMLTDGGTRPPTDQEQAFMENLSAEVGRFLTARDRIAVSLQPEDSIFIDEATFESPSEAVALLKPVVSSVPAALRSMIPADVLTAALAGGAGMSDQQKLASGVALVTGIGAPKAPAEGQALLLPLANAWSGPAASALATSFADAEQLDVAYAMALKALAAGESGAAGVADGLELDMDLANVLGAQRAAAESFPGGGDLAAMTTALIADGDVSGIRKHAYALIQGRTIPRDYALGYYWASLAAAAGDRGAANLRDRLDQRFGNDAVWRATAQAQGSEALSTWTSGLAAKISERIR